MKKSKWESIHLEFDGKLLHIIPTEDLNYKQEDLFDFHEFVVDFVENKEHLVLSDYRNHFLQLSRETMLHAAKSKEINRLKIGEAVLINSLPNLMVARFFIRTMKPLKPVQVFRKKHNALHWLDRIHSKAFQNLTFP